MQFDSLVDARFFFFSHSNECLTIWVEACWPEGLFCPECEWYLSDDLPEKGRRIRCPECNSRFDIFEGTILESSRLSLPSCLTIIWNAVCSEERNSGHHLADVLGSSYHDLRDAIKAIEAVKNQLRKDGLIRRGVNKFEAVIRGCLSLHTTT